MCGCQTGFHRGGLGAGGRGAGVVLRLWSKTYPLGCLLEMWIPGPHPDLLNENLRECGHSDQDF